MPTRKVAVTIDEQTLRAVDHWVEAGMYPNRSRAVQAALEDMLRRRQRTRLALEAAKLDSDEEQSMAEEALGDDAWPEC